MLNPGIARSYTSISTSSRFWSRVRVQIGGGLLFAVVLPIFVLTLFDPQGANTLAAQFTAGGGAFAAFLSVYLFRNISLYPGIKGSSFILPSVLVAYGFTFLIFMMFRLDYSRVVIISSGAAMLMWLSFAQSMSERRPSLRVGVVPVGGVGGLSEVPSLEINWLAEPILNAEYDLLVADFRADLSDDWEAFLADCALKGLPVLHVKQLLETLTGRVEIEHISENSFGSLIPFMGYLQLRRGFDLISALFVGVLFSPVFIAIAIAIKLDSPGPVLFRQIRIGHRGQPFSVAKFRTMIVHGHFDARGDAMTRENDDRITKVGRFLRRTRLDELAQILNIVRGEMSWIGPRPEAEPLSRWYESELPFYRYRHIVPPGITGWAQVNQGHVFELDQVMSKLHFDFYYIKNFSPWLDALILAKTVHTVVSGFGSK